ncbi:MAG: T9SS type A sorting domain-containing protein [Chitinophagaceae bacterium]|nr:T9SS type A sorting domain-containing protein [Chitinophagaceae bacterium]
MRSFITSLLLLVTIVSKAQVAGDTIVVQAFDYTQNTYGQGDRKMMVNFPSQPGLTFEKILMLYNMRCKGGAVGSQVPPSGTLGCGEWDYSCNTYVTDSTKTDSVKSKHPSHIIPGFSGTSFPYTALPTYTYYQYNQQQVTITATTSENFYTTGTGASLQNEPFRTQLPEHKSQFLWTAAELQTSGMLAGNITGIQLQVSTAGSDAKFLKIRMKHSSQTALNASSPELTGFTEVYFLNTTFTTGLNQLHFYNPFNWNGTDNILIEFSYSNATSGTSTTVTSDATSFISGLSSAGNDYHFDFTSANMFALNNTNWNTINDQVSIAFWSKGNAAILPTNTSVLHGHTNTGSRQLNVHLPWSNSRVYWDCGNGSGYDRIDKFDSTSAFENGWNYWTFTKNTTTGIMNTYLNGNLWHSGSNKTISLLLNNLVLGSGYNGDVPYFGKMDEFSIWNTELSQSDIQTWMRKDVTSAHPQYANLLGYYKFNEGNGTQCNDAATTAISTVNSPVWHLTKGKDIFRGFDELSIRPAITFVQGVYTQTITSNTLLDSIANNPYTVYSFSTNGTSISAVDTQQHYIAGYTYIYDGDNGNLLDSVLNATANTITITQLDYYKFYPSRFQIMSFVTPYGNGLDLGVNGKTYTFDMSDYAPILKGSKLLTMDAGGQWQEDMDVKFLFIVGTPPREVRSIDNIWRVDNTGYTNILNDSYFEPRTIPLPSGANKFKIRTAITGHGQEGEFLSQTHWMNLNGGSPEYVWDVWKTCGENPVYPSGGTWVYDRAGWCPGMATDTKEMPLDNFVNPGDTVTFDYGLNTASGDSRYWVSNQLVSYGTPNFTLDAAVTDVLNPSLKVEYARTNAICANPKVIIQNTGATTLTSATIEYWVNNNPVHQTFAWTGNLESMKSLEVQIPSDDNLWTSLDTVNNVFHAEIKNPNGGSDGYSYNNVFHSKFNIPPVYPANIVVSFKTNAQAFENSYAIRDQLGNVVHQRNNVSNNTTYTDTVYLAPGCYNIKLLDTGGDGISFWANPNAGSGWFRLRKLGGAIFKTFNMDFGSSIETNFTVDFPLSFETMYPNDQLTVYPNPTSGWIDVLLPESLSSENNLVEVKDMMGRTVRRIFSERKNNLRINLSDLQKGMYLLTTAHRTVKVIVE